MKHQAISCARSRQLISPSLSLSHPTSVIRHILSPFSFSVVQPLIPALYIRFLSLCSVHLHLTSSPARLLTGLPSPSRFYIVSDKTLGDSARNLGMDDQITLKNGEVELLPAVDDCFGGVNVELLNHMEAEVFQTKLRASMSKWRQQGKKGIWLKLPIELVNLVETAVKEGFWYHHAEKTYLMLVQWIPQIVPMIPPNASHRVSVGAIVVTEKRELLVVQEANGRWRGRGIWKIPTGVVEQGEDIRGAVAREVKEETGVDTEFIEVLAFRESHKSFFEKSDMFFICFLRPLSFDIQKQDSEIDAAQWMSLEEFAAKSTTQKSSIFKWTVDLCLAKLEKNYTGFCPRHVSSSFASPESLLYLNTRDVNLGDSSHQP